MMHSLLMGDEKQIGPPSSSLEVLMDRASLLPLDWPGVIVHVEGPVLQQWKKLEEPDE
jgi:hypothetical protein